MRPSCLARQGFVLGFATAIMLFAPSVRAQTSSAAPTGEKGAQNPTRADLPENIFPGGRTTWLRKTGRNAFTHYSANMAFEKRLDFKLGEALFQRMWVAAPTRTRTTDGLGPLYNSRSCIGCHVRNGRGHPLDLPDGVDFPTDPAKPTPAAVPLLLRLSIPPQNAHDREMLKSGKMSFIPDPVYGNQFQNLSLPGIPAEGRIRITYSPITVNLTGGQTVTLHRPEYHIDRLAYGPFRKQIMISPRVAPPLIGMGLLEAISDDQILANADPDDANGDGISGRVNRVWNIAKNKVSIGRFGWKAGMPTLDQQNQNAMQFDVGLSTPLYPNGSGDCTAAEEKCMAAPNGNDRDYENLEAHSTITNLVLYYSRNLAPPVRRKGLNAEVRAGEKIFAQIGCASCHHPRYKLPERADMPEQSGQVIWPYSDLLLHDMGEGLADHRPEAQASGREWRTAPLWGLGRTHEIDARAGFLHDGRARTILEAILWHGGEAQTARDAVTKLAPEDRAKLIAFLKSL